MTEQLDDRDRVLAEIDRRLALCEAAASGRWRVSSPETVARDGGGLLITVRIGTRNEGCRETLIFIAHARAGYPEALRFSRREVERHNHGSGKSAWTRERCIACLQQWPCPTIADALREFLGEAKHE